MKLGNLQDALVQINFMCNQNKQNYSSFAFMRFFFCATLFVKFYFTRREPEKEITHFRWYVYVIYRPML